jgi:hypothetical protein
MTELLADDWSRRTVRIGGEEIPVWPEAQKVSRLEDSTVLVTCFADAPRYHPELIRKTLEQESNSRYKADYALGGCGVKIYNLNRWQSAEAELIHLRALAFYSQAFNCPEPVADISMANIFRNGEYCVPHSHSRTRASLVYSVTCGDPDPRHPLSGQLCFVDPRMEVCCQEDAGRMTTPLIPDMQPGTLIMFPSKAVHCVTPYTGKSPRITLAWNIDSEPVPGDAIPGGLPGP